MVLDPGTCGLSGNTRVKLMTTECFRKPAPHTCANLAIEWLCRVYSSFGLALRGGFLSFRGGMVGAYVWPTGCFPFQSIAFGFGHGNGSFACGLFKRIIVSDTEIVRWPAGCCVQTRGSNVQTLADAYGRCYLWVAFGRRNLRVVR
eukprot:4625351-Amphidinium_carterae.1